MQVIVNLYADIRLKAGFIMYNLKNSLDLFILYLNSIYMMIYK